MVLIRYLAQRIATQTLHLQGCCEALQFAVHEGLDGWSSATDAKQISRTCLRVEFGVTNTRLCEEGLQVLHTQTEIHRGYQHEN